jgi:hypothetical protein
MERQGDRPVEDARRPRKLALVAVGGEPVERVGTDLGLDPLLAEGRDLVGGAVDLDHVGLPTVDVALVGTRGLDDVTEALGVPGRDPGASLQELAEARELRDPDRAEDVGEAVVQTRVRDFEAPAGLDPASSASSVVTAPPSPVVTILRG